MASIGPQLPPKRRRGSAADESDDSSCSAPKRPKTTTSNTNEISLDDSDSDAESSAGLAPPPKPQPIAKQTIGPALPPSASPRATIGPALPPSTSPKATIGPALPPLGSLAGFEEDEDEDAKAGAKDDDDDDNDDDDDDDDDYGPALPSKASSRSIGPSMPLPAAPSAAPQPLQRDSWMLAPPTETKQRAPDPTRLKARKFATGRAAASSSANGGEHEVSSIWTETAEEKKQRLANALLGRGDPDGAPQGRREARPEDLAARREQERRVQEYNANKHGAKSLYEQHQEGKKETAPEEDDPSKRAFDKEKDMALGGKINTTQRRELLNRAADFGGRFSKGSYL